MSQARDRSVGRRVDGAHGGVATLGALEPRVMLGGRSAFRRGLAGVGSLGLRRSLQGLHTPGDGGWQEQEQERDARNEPPGDRRVGPGLLLRTCEGDRGWCLARAARDAVHRQGVGGGSAHRVGWEPVGRVGAGLRGAAPHEPGSLQRGHGRLVCLPATCWDAPVSGSRGHRMPGPGAAAPAGTQVCSERLGAAVAVQFGRGGRGEQRRAESRRHLGRHPQRRGGSRVGRRGDAGEGMAQRHAEAVDVAARARCGPGTDRGVHVAGRAVHAERTGDPEVDEQRLPVGGEHDVGGGHITVQDAPTVGGGQRPSELDPELKRDRPGKTCVAQLFVQGAALGERHDHRDARAVVHAGQHGDDVGMVELGEDRGLIAQLLASRPVGCAAQTLHRDDPAGAGAFPCAPHFACRTTCDLLKQHIVGEIAHAGPPCGVSPVCAAPTPAHVSNVPHSGYVKV